MKDLYTKRNFPPLKIVLSGSTIVKIENLQLINYLFLFFEDKPKDLTIEEALTNSFKKYKKFSKSFYQTNFRKLLSTDFFKYLIDNCSEKLPIIPLPEKVKTRSGSECIDDSFIFPIEIDKRIIWVWESVEESKATYCFNTSYDYYEDELHPIFNYLTSELENKRQTLTRKIKINDIEPALKITHRNFQQWKNELEKLLKY